jgi:hypothetical protein
MNRSFVTFAALAVASIVAPTLARAQSYGAAYNGQPPFYPYAVQPGQPYAVEVAPNTYVIRRPAASRAYPYLHRASAIHHRVSAKALRASASDQPRVKTDRHHSVGKRIAKHGVVETKTIVHEKPVVVETRRVVNDPPRVIERRHYVEDAPASPAAARQKPAAAEARVTGALDKRGDGKQRVIHAEAEVTILGPDRMSIRLFRKRAVRDAKASAD